MSQVAKSRETLIFSRVTFRNKVSTQKKETPNRSGHFWHHLDGRRVGRSSDVCLSPRSVLGGIFAFFFCELEQREINREGDLMEPNCVFLEVVNLEFLV